MKVTIPRINEHCGLRSNLITVEISNFCPKCGAMRGIKRWQGLSFDGSRRLEVDCWQNECWHIDMYEDIREEIKNYCTSSARTQEEDNEHRT